MKNFKNFIYYNCPVYKENITVNEAVRKLVAFQLSRNISINLSNVFETNEYLVSWICFECQTAISINTKYLLNEDEQLQASDFFCDKHKHESHKVNQRISISWIRFENSFHKKLQHIIQEKVN